MTIDTQEYNRIINDVKRTEYQKGYDDGVSNKRVAEYQRGYDDGVKDIFATICRAFKDNLDRKEDS